MRIKPEEIDTIKSTFKDNDNLLKVLRKVFLPEIEGDTPIGSGIDLWMTIPFQGLTAEEKVAKVEARNELIRHVETQLLQLKVLANTEAKTLKEARDALQKNSNK